MLHNKKLVLGAVSLTTQKPNRFALKVMSEIRAELDVLLKDKGFIANAPFSQIGIIFQYGLVNATEPKYQKINIKYGDLPVTIELDASELFKAKATQTELKVIMKNSALIVLKDIAKKYNLRADIFQCFLIAGYITALSSDIVVGK